MSNKLKIILAIITSILIISGSAIIFNSQRRNSQISKTELSSSSSSSTVSSSTSSQVSSVVISSSSVESSLVSLPSSAVASSSQMSVQASSVQVQSQVSNNQPKYLTDYLNCSTKFFEPLNGFYSEDGGVNYKYTCIPQKEIDTCSANGNKNPSIVFGFDFMAGRKLTTVDPYFQKTYKKDEIIQSGRFYCGQYNEGGGLSGVMTGGGYGYKCLDNQTKKQLDNFVLPKSIISKNGANIECFSISKQLYSKNDQQILKDKFSI